MNPHIRLLSVVLLVGGCAPRVTTPSDPSTRPSASRAEGILAALAADDDAAVVAASAEVLRYRSSGPVGELARHAQAWAGAGDDRLARLEHLDRVLDAAKATSASAATLTPITLLRARLMTQLQAELRALEASLTLAARGLRCDELRELDASA